MQRAFLAGALRWKTTTTKTKTIKDLAAKQEPGQHSTHEDAALRYSTYSLDGTAHDVYTPAVLTSQRGRTESGALDADARYSVGGTARGAYSNYDAFGDDESWERPLQTPPLGQSWERPLQTPPAPPPRRKHTPPPSGSPPREPASAESIHEKRPGEKGVHSSDELAVSPGKPLESPPGGPPPRKRHPFNEPLEEHGGQDEAASAAAPATASPVTDGTPTSKRRSVLGAAERHPLDASLSGKESGSENESGSELGAAQEGFGLPPCLLDSDSPGPIQRQQAWLREQVLLHAEAPSQAAAQTAEVGEAMAKTQAAGEHDSDDAALTRELAAAADTMLAAELVAGADAALSASLVAAAAAAASDAVDRSFKAMAVLPPTTVWATEAPSALSELLLEDEAKSATLAWVEPTAPLIAEANGSTHERRRSSADLGAPRRRLFEWTPLGAGTAEFNLNELEARAAGPPARWQEEKLVRKFVKAVLARANALAEAAAAELAAKTAAEAAARALAEAEAAEAALVRRVSAAIMSHALAEAEARDAERLAEIALHRRKFALQAQALGRAAIAANDKGDSRQALMLFSKAISLDPDTPNYPLSAGNMLLKMGEADKAIAMYERCERLTLSPLHSKMLSEKRARARKALAACHDELPSPLEAPAMATTALAESVAANAVATAIALVEAAPAIARTTHRPIDHDQWTRQPEQQLLVRGTSPCGTGGTVDATPRLVRPSRPDELEILLAAESECHRTLPLPPRPKPESAPPRPNPLRSLPPGSGVTLLVLSETERSRLSPPSLSGRAGLANCPLGRRRPRVHTPVAARRVRRRRSTAMGGSNLTESAGRSVPPFAMPIFPRAPTRALSARVTTLRPHRSLSTARRRPWSTTARQESPSSCSRTRPRVACAGSLGRAASCAASSSCSSSPRSCLCSCLRPHGTSPARSVRTSTTRPLCPRSRPCPRHRPRSTTRP